MRAYVSKSISEFHSSSSNEVLLELINAGGFTIQDNQKRAWEVEIDLLKKHLPRHISGRVLFEYTIPRVGKRVDVIIATSYAIFVIEFKVNANTFFSADKDQAIDYALDLKNFHETSHDCLIVPVLELPKRHHCQSLGRYTKTKWLTSYFPMAETLMR